MPNTNNSKSSRLNSSTGSGKVSRGMASDARDRASTSHKERFLLGDPKDRVPPKYRGSEIEDREYRKAYPGTHLRSAYLSIVGENPNLRPGDKEGALQMLNRIREALDREGGTVDGEGACWTQAERRRLRAMEKKYLLRSQGRDARFNLFGNKKTGLTPRQLQQLRTHQIIQKMKDVAEGLEPEEDDQSE